MFLNLQRKGRAAEFERSFSPLLNRFMHIGAAGTPFAELSGEVGGAPAVDESLWRSKP